MKKAFTLAEVLITLMIIGIVAALTIPSVISNYQQQEFKTGLKKAVSVLNAAIQANIAIEGETPYENRHLFDYLQRHMNVIRTLERYSKACMSSQDKGIIKSEDAESCGDGDMTENSAFYTADGMRFEKIFGAARYNVKLHESDVDISNRYYINEKFYSNRSNDAYCGSYGLANNPHGTINPPCIILVDVNGDKKPNPVIMTEETDDSGNRIPINLNASPYFYPAPTDKKLTDIFNILITDEKAIPFGVVAQRAMYSK